MKCYLCRHSERSEESYVWDSSSQKTLLRMTQIKKSPLESRSRAFKEDDTVLL